MENILCNMKETERQELKKLCYDCKLYQTTESEAKKAKEEIKNRIKDILDKYNFSGKETFDIFRIDYTEQEKTIPDSDKLKADGLFEKYSKTQKTKPLTIR